MVNNMAEEQSTEDLYTSPEEMEQLKALMGATPSSEEKQNVHTFLHNVATADDTTKLGNLKEEELGMPKIPQRTYQELAVFCEDVANMKYFGEYFRKKAEIITSTSLSKEAKLISLAVLTRREHADVTKPRAINKGWFKKKEVPVE